MTGKKKQTSVKFPPFVSPADTIAALIGGALAAALAGACLLWVFLDPGGLSFPRAGVSSPMAGWILPSLWTAGALMAMVLALIAQWRVLRRAAAGPQVAKPAPAAKSESPPHAAAVMREQRLFVYLLSRFQREGRLMDFLAEDLNAYHDDQIGAAVRSVHAGCRRVVEKLLAPQPVLDRAEQSPVTLAGDYDAGAITLTGRVGDHPPFEGIVRHTGWRASRIEIPLLAEESDPAIVAPAEVEVQ